MRVLHHEHVTLLFFHMGLFFGVYSGHVNHDAMY